MVESARKICKRLHRYMQLQPCRGRVVSVFARAVNIEMPFGLMAVLTGEQCLHPFSCLVSGVKPFPQMQLTEGAEVLLTSECISIPSVDFSIHTSQATDIDLAVDAMENLFVPVDISLRLRHVLRVIETHATAEDLSPLVLESAKGNAYSELVAPRLLALRTALAEQDTTSCASIAGTISGCGIGLPPSSDDMLTGYFAGYAALSYALGRGKERVLKLTRAMASSAAQNTTDLSSAFLLQCGEGLVSEDVLQLLYSLFSDAPHPTLLSHASRVAAFGGSSGVDILAGLYLAVIHHYGGKNLD